MIHIERELKRVPLDFAWPIERVWYGYRIRTCLEEKQLCSDCREFAKLKDLPVSEYGCPDLEKLVDPPEGEGFQMWNTVTGEAFPMSPVFSSLEKLCDWCEKHAYLIATIKASKERWREVLTKENDVI